ncbi:MAG: nucleotidyltransferase domain-containing protein [Candidatus Aenigmatarchaeota archaeon]
MLEIINNLRPFFENCYARISVRQYSRLIKVSPPTASTLLSMYEKDGLLTKEKDRNYMMFRANQKDNGFIMLSRIYWQQRLEKFVRGIESPDAVVLFGSLSKAEAKPDSDADICIIGGEKKDIEKFMERTGRKIQVFWFDSLRDADKELRNNVINGHILSGRLEL